MDNTTQILKSNTDAGETAPAHNMYINYVKESVGIALCRKCPVTKNLQILLVHKRLSYAFLHFILGKYNISLGYSDISNLVSNMSVNEKLEILSLNFDHLWYKIWLHVPCNNYNTPNGSYHKNWLKKYKNTDALSLNTKDCYKHCKKKFYDLISKDGGQQLRDAIINTSHNRAFLWEIPKGRLDDDEAKIQCAMRELFEETNIKSDQYDISFDIKPFTLNKTYADARYRYRHTFYVAIMKNHNTPVEIDFGNINQITEVDNLQWYSLNEMNIIWKDINSSQSLKKIVKKIFKCISNRKLIQN
jgi:8-oxo-dGTP pyrophosphatase MutT (NUDIX family)